MAPKGSRTSRSSSSQSLSGISPQTAHRADTKHWPFIFLRLPTFQTGGLPSWLSSYLHQGGRSIPDVAAPVSRLERPLFCFYRLRSTRQIQGHRAPCSHPGSILHETAACIGPLAAPNAAASTRGLNCCTARTRGPPDTSWGLLIDICIREREQEVPPNGPQLFQIMAG